MADMPTGTVTFLFTDVEGSTRLWEDHPDAMQESLERHDAILRGAIESQGGYVFSTAGDAFAAAFARADDGVVAACQAQRELEAEEWPAPATIRVRMGLHSGESQERDGNYFGPPLNRAARLMSAANGGQVVLSGVTAELVRSGLPQTLVLEDLGEHRLKDLSRPERVFGVSGSGMKDIRLRLRTVDGVPGNLPSLLPAFIGREAEVGSLLNAVHSQRLVTVVGPPGTGKTRTAIQAVAEMASEFQGGAWLVDLAVERTAQDVTAATARALSVTADSGVPLLDALTDFLRYRPTLVLFDNCEGVIEPARAIIEQLLEDCPRLTVLATSRELLRGRAEFVFPIGPMEGGSGSEAVALFMDRARSAGASAKQIEDESAIAELCAHLDGLPLAIELAAARARSIGPRQMLALLDERFRLLKAGRPNATARHATLLSAIDWSYELLDDDERALSDRMSLFAGPFEVADAFAVASDDDVDELDILERLSALVDRSMVVAVPGQPPTYRLLETLREYGRTRLRELGVEADLRRRHAEHLLEKALAARDESVGPNHVPVLDILVAQAGDFRASTEWALDQGDLDLAVSLSAAFCGVTYFRVGFEALDWLGPDPASLIDAETALAAELLGMLSRRSVFAGDLASGRRLAEESIKLDPGPGSVQARTQMVFVARDGDDMSPLEWATSAVEIAIGAEDQLGILAARLMQGLVAGRMGRLDEAIAVGELMLEQGRQRDSGHAEGWGHWVLGRALSKQYPEKSREHVRLALEFGQSEKNRYLESNARLAEFEQLLNIGDPAKTAEAALETLRKLEDVGDNGNFTRLLLMDLTVFLANHGHREAIQLDAYLRAFSGTWPQLGGDVAVEALAGGIGDEVLAGLREAGARLTAEEANQVAVSALTGIIES